jgi:hypothetical protein
MKGFKVLALQCSFLNDARCVNTASESTQGTNFDINQKIIEKWTLADSKCEH